MTSPLPPAGWFLDPNDATRERWWNGSSWTDHFRASAAATVPPVGTVSGSPRSWRLTGTTVITVAIALVIALIALASGGFGGFLVVAGLFGVAAAVWTLATKKPGWLNLDAQNPAVKIIVGVSAAALLLGAIVLPHPTNASADNAVPQSLLSTSGTTPSTSATATPKPTPTPTPTPTPVKVPLAAVGGQSADAAESALKAAGFAVTKTASDGSTPSDWTGWTVSEQRPAAGTPVPSGSTVVLVFAPPPAPEPVVPAEPVPAPEPVVEPEPAPAEPEPAPEPDPAPAPEAYYANCTAAREAGVTPLYAGDPGYSSKLDRDGDGVACE